MSSAMGAVLLAFEILAVVAAAYWVAAAIFPDTGAWERVATTALWAIAIVLWSVQLCGLAHRFAARPVAATTFALALVTAGVASRRVPLSALRRQWALDLGAPARVLRDAWAQREPAFWVAAVGAAAFLLNASIVGLFRSWAWDAVWYHVPITAFTIQEQSTGWITTHIPWISSYPRNVEWLAAWACVLLGDARLDDVPQLPFGVVGVAVLAAWSRRTGASSALAAGVGGAFLLLPPVFLQLHTSYVDVACATLLCAAVFFASGDRARWMAALALGLYAGTKFSGLFHLALLLPWLAWRSLQALRASTRRARTVAGFAGSALFFASVSAHAYVLNLLHTGNPTYPFEVRLPLLGTLFPGPWQQHRLFEVPAGTRLYFFGVPGALGRTFWSWFEKAPHAWPDIRTGGFGPLFPWLLLPALVALVVQLVRRRIAPARALPILGLFLAAFAVPATWWPRYVLGGGGAALVAFAAWSASLESVRLRLALSGAFLILAGFGLGTTLAQMQGPFPARVHEAVRTGARGRATAQLASWMWPDAAAQLREAELRAGDVVAYDESASFVGELFSPDYRTRVVHVPSAGDPKDYLRRLSAVGARWAGVRSRSDAERALEVSGWERLFPAPRSDLVMYRRPRPTF